MSGPDQLDSTIASETLSAYLDGELAPAEVRALEARLEDDAASRQKLEGLRQVVDGLRRTERLTPPPTLDYLVARRIALERARVSWLDRIDGGASLFSRRQNPLLALFAVVVALAIFIVVFAIAVHRNETPGIEVVIPTPGTEAASTHVPGTRLELAGRIFFWADGAWRQREAEGEPTAEVILGTAEGDAWLAAHADLAPLAELGEPALVWVDDAVVLVRPAVAEAE